MAASSAASAVALASLLVAAAVAPAAANSPTAAEQLSWSDYLSQTFYHSTILPLLIASMVLAIKARPSTTDDFPPGFVRFQLIYISVWMLCVGADWLQGPFVYALYADYGFSGREIAQLFVAGFGSSLVFGCFVGTFADKFGRKRSCVIYCIMYIASCMTKHYKDYWVLMLGRVTGGIATSMLFSCFECWMVSEHVQRNSFPGSLLGYMFGVMFTVMYIVAIVSGLAGQVVADAAEFGPMSEGGIFHMGGKLGPFDLAIGLLVVGMALIAVFFEENYGQKDSEGGGSPGAESSLMDNIRKSAVLLMSDRRVLLLGVVVSTFEGSMYAFVFNWTPALDSAVIPPPHGVIFALFMMSCMCGASTSTLLGHLKPTMRLTGTFAAGFLAFALCAYASTGSSEDYLRTSFVAFLLFEFCCGVYFPTVGVLKSDIVPEDLRATVYNMYRVPLNAIVVGLLLSDISMASCFKMNALFLLMALGSILAINSMQGESGTKVTSAAPAEKGTYEMVPHSEVSNTSKVGSVAIGRRRGANDADDTV